MKIPDPETIRLNAIAHLRELNEHEPADILGRSKIEIADKAPGYAGSVDVELNINLRCRSIDLPKFVDQYHMPSDISTAIESAIQSILPLQTNVSEMTPKSYLVDRKESDKSELERLIEAQISLMITVATGGPKIDLRNDEYQERRRQIQDQLKKIGMEDPNPYSDLWAWHGRWSSGDLPTYQSRRDYIRELYQILLEDLAGAKAPSPSEPSREPTGWEKVDRIIDTIVQSLAKAKNEEDYQAIGLFCRECLIALSQAVYDPDRHKTRDGVVPSKTDAYRMLEAYFSSEYTGSHNEALRRHAKASLILANQLQHKNTAEYKEAALCSEATRTVVNIVAIASGKR